MNETATLPDDPTAVPTVVSGVVPGEDPLNPYTPDPALVQIHATGVAAIAPSVAELLAVNAATTADSGTSLTSNGTPSQDSVPGLRNGGQNQYHSSWCSPASGNSDLIPKSIWPAQEAIAKAMHTDANGVSGTYFTNMPPAMNHYYNWWIADTDNNAADLMNKVVFEVEDGRVGMTLEVQGGVLPKWKKYGYTGLHSITVYGYDTYQGGHMLIWDPLEGNAGGLGKITLQTAWTANQGSSDEVVY